MALKDGAVLCAASQWTLIADGVLNILVNLPKTGTLYIRRVSAGATAPTVAPDPDGAPADVGFHFMTMTALKPYAASFTEACDVYGYPDGSDGLRVEMQGD
ncbi:hypothetical protein [Allorhizobium taibaishanense]|uniref:Uncharacterized protein n=1 Tax=Allorhizobium taibaishanense TaxID=887144 RepID=A0A1Q9A2T2_9HYPH|nr:hypothetical protein [Allorhizobium taibaishanense]MBB4005787.1 hypothetical protein [Allorhizobium taibaishanense]OLP48836.1 hypothetical protein BJF91_17020 [Allorhizobium taibaishanense]